jgi:peptidase E
MDSIKLFYYKNEDLISKTLTYLGVSAGAFFTGKFINYQRLLHLLRDKQEEARRLRT